VGAIVANVVDVDVDVDVLVELVAPVPGEGPVFTAAAARALVDGGVSTRSMAALRATAATTTTTIAAVTLAGETRENTLLTLRVVAVTIRMGSGCVT
jgi:hypothetical protein